MQCTPLHFLSIVRVGAWCSAQRIKISILAGGKYSLIHHWSPAKGARSRGHKNKAGLPPCFSQCYHTTPFVPCRPDPPICKNPGHFPGFSHPAGSRPVSSLHRTPLEPVGAIIDRPPKAPFDEENPSGVQCTPLHLLSIVRVGAIIDRPRACSARPYIFFRWCV